MLQKTSYTWPMLSTSLIGRALTLGLLACVPSACGDDSVTGLEGVYVVATWSENPTGCETEGVDVAASNDGFAFVRHQAFFGEDLVSAGTCPTQAECEEEAFVGEDELRISGLIFERGSDDAGWEGEVGSTSWSGDSECNATVRYNQMTWDGMSITLRTEEKRVEPFAQTANPDDPCPFETAVELSKTTACSSLRVITATPL